MAFDGWSVLIGAVVGNAVLATKDYFMQKHKYNREEDKDAVNRARDLTNKICEASIAYWSKPASIEENQNSSDEIVIKVYFSQLNNVLHEIEHLDPELEDDFLTLKGVIQLQDFESPKRKANKDLSDLKIPKAVQNMQRKITNAYSIFYK
ncbi:MAG: hypothetical protein KAJ75_01290 [Alphaproteobacteria bacterium]|nr:hypothetical protein [Alphaproteobacteria bacterium]